MALISAVLLCIQLPLFFCGHLAPIVLCGSVHHQFAANFLRYFAHFFKILVQWAFVTIRLLACCEVDILGSWSGSLVSEVSILDSGFVRHANQSFYIQDSEVVSDVSPCSL